MSTHGLKLLTLLAICFPHLVRADLTVDGVTNHQVATDLATFRVPSEAGFTYDCRLNGQPIATDTLISCGPDYYDLSLERTEIASGASSGRLIQFIVRSSERGGSEVGLRPWTPFPPISSSPAEFEGNQLHLVVPRSFPSGIDLPVIALVQTPQGDPVRVNGVVTFEGASSGSLYLRRGFGSALLPGLPGAAAGTLRATVGGLSELQQIVGETSVSWTSVGGTMNGVVEWPENSRIQVTNTLVVPASAELRIGAGSVLQLGPGVNLDITGKLKIAGTLSSPVVFTPGHRSAPWGGMFFRTNSTVGELHGTILTGSGANAKWFTENTGYSVHRKEQALLLVENGAQVTLTDCFLIDNQGQAGHGKKGFVTFNRTLIQRCITGGEYSGGSVKLLSSALLEFPKDDGIFADDDNDAIYFTTGDHFVINSLIGWAKDDALDAGTGGLGTMTVSNCWIESNFHEGMAWSGNSGRTVNAGHCVVMNCGQGIEAGFGKPIVNAGELLSLGNLTGARFGDNYDWTYDGFLRVTNSILLHNFRDIWGQTWTPGAWTNELDQMDLQGNQLTVANPLHPKNTVWDPQTQGESLGVFLGSLAGKPVGVGFALRDAEITENDWTNGIPVGLSRFHTRNVTVAFRVEHSDRKLVASGTLTFEPGETIKRIPASNTAGAREPGFYLIRLQAVLEGVVTGRPWVFFAPQEPSAPFTTTLISKKSTWSYWDQGSEPAGDWRGVDYPETGWKSGRAELGFGDGDETTTLTIGPAERHYTGYYFRQAFSVTEPQHLTSLALGFLRDDGGIVYLNGTEVFRSNMRPGVVHYEDTAAGNTSSETAFFATNVASSWLRVGRNVVAAEVHQSQTNSADLSFDLELIGQNTLPHPQLTLVHSDGEKWLVWRQVGFVLQSAESVSGPWATESGAKSPFAILSSGRSRFYRLALP